MFRIVRNKKRLTRLDENLTADIVLAGKDSSLIFEEYSDLMFTSKADNANNNSVLFIFINFEFHYKHQEFSFCSICI